MVDQLSSNHPKWKKGGTWKIKAKAAYSELKRLQTFGRIYWAKVVSVNLENEKPLRVGRKWGSDVTRPEDYEVDCYVTERIKELYQDGKLSEGDIVIIQFVDGDAEKPVAIAKGFKTW